MKEKPFVVLIEDNDDDVALIQRVFNRAQITAVIDVITDGADALDYFKGTGRYAGRDITQQPKFVMLDLKLPRIDGLQILSHLKENPQTRNLPVIVLTSSSEERDLMKSYELGVNSYIRKPVNYTEFAQTVEDVGRYWISLNKSISG